MNTTPTYAIIIPAFNEAASIGRVVATALNFGYTIVVDDGSRDETAAVAKMNGADVVTHRVNSGYDDALNSGFRRAAELGCLYAVTLDADGQHNPDLIAKFFTGLRQGNDVVIGVRDRRQRFAEHIFAWVASSLWGVKDPLCGMKGYRMSVYNRLGHFDSFGSIGTELALFAACNELSVAQIAIPTFDRIGSSRFGSVVSANFRILRALFLALWRVRARSD